MDNLLSALSIIRNNRSVVVVVAGKKESFVRTRFLLPLSSTSLEPDTSHITLACLVISSHRLHIPIRVFIFIFVFIFFSYLSLRSNSLSSHLLLIKLSTFTDITRRVLLRHHSVFKRPCLVLRPHFNYHTLHSQTPRSSVISVSTHHKHVSGSHPRHSQSWIASRSRGLRKQKLKKTQVQEN